MGSGPPQLSSAASSPYSLHLPGCHAPGGERGAHCCPQCPPGSARGTYPSAQAGAAPRSPAAPLCLCSGPSDNSVPRFRSICLGHDFHGSVLGLRGRLHFNGGPVHAECSTGRRSSAAGAVWGGSSQDQKGCFMAQTCSSGARPWISIWQSLNLFQFLTSSRDRHICLPNLRKEFNSVYFKNLAQS